MVKLLGSINSQPLNLHTCIYNLSYNVVTHYFIAIFSPHHNYPKHVIIINAA